ncbi:ArpU family phage packaging/lysis transcriptional regulator [Neobacillus sp. PS3-40]|uniref:ArpU family phage packaging/lysis transcriptional regulator n=1 Tax=Neobacillus sp. PS3-40 TaxID=3070679 RepID=UPI0027E1ABC8|nr:ArpU family phage packaging/lysis transcriptional regulator [Neobacillus sp. PS3-40]WML42702.1 ArpU family phage packaging/lysis transcriptional regulator [Neobacillus sp. PS3-40]
MYILKSLSTAEKLKIRKAVEKELERYQLYKTTAFFNRETNITSSYEPRYHGPTNHTSDQTGNAAVHNADEQDKRAALCERMEKAIERLPEKERLLIEKRYTDNESQYTTNYQIYCFEFDPPISEVTFNTIRNRAILKLALILGIDCGVDLQL